MDGRIGDAARPPARDDLGALPARADLASQSHGRPAGKTLRRAGARYRRRPARGDALVRSAEFGTNTEVQALPARQLELAYALGRPQCNPLSLRCQQRFLRLVARPAGGVLVRVISGPRRAAPSWPRTTAPSPL